VRVRVKVRVGQWLLVALAALLLTSGLMALFALDASTTRAVAGEGAPASGLPSAGSD
jgi:hypothetical protein